MGAGFAVSQGQTPPAKTTEQAANTIRSRYRFFIEYRIRLTKKAEPPPTRDVNRDSGTDSANGGWLRRLVRPHGHIISRTIVPTYIFCSLNPLVIFVVNEDVSPFCPIYIYSNRNSVLTRSVFIIMIIGSILLFAWRQFLDIVLIVSNNCLAEKFGILAKAKTPTSTF